MTQQPTSYTAPQTLSQLENAFSANDYKAIVCIFFFGGTDSHNMIVPYGSNPNRGPYEQVRATGTRVEQSELSNSILSGTNSQWALHPQLPFFLTEWENNNLAIVRDVGILNKPTTKSDFLSDPSYSPTSLFAHNIQQLAWQAGLPFKATRTTGWFGRTANLIDSTANPNATVTSSSLSTTGATLQGFPYSPKNVIPYPATFIDRVNSDPSYLAVWDLMSSRANSSSPLRKLPRQNNLIHNAFNDIFLRSIESQESLQVNAGGWNPNDGGLGQALENIFTLASTELDNTDVPVPDPEGGTTTLKASGAFLNTFKNIAKLVYSRGGDEFTPGLRQQRQLIFAGVSQFDHHNYLRYKHDPLLRGVDRCYKALVDALTLMGVYDNVTIFTESDFGRTLRSNGTSGTDHAWSGHSFVMGGSVIKGLYGAEPDYTLNGPQDVYADNETSLGRYIPRISTEQYYATLLKWMDIPENLIELILPSLPLYPVKDLGFMG